MILLQTIFSVFLVLFHDLVCVVGPGTQNGNNAHQNAKAKLIIWVAETCTELCQDIILPLLQVFNPFSGTSDSCQQLGRLPLASCQKPGRLSLMTTVHWKGLNTANSLHSSIRKSVLVNHVIICQLIVKVWLQCVLAVSGVRFG